MIHLELDEFVFDCPDTVEGKLVDYDEHNYRGEAKAYVHISKEGLQVTTVGAEILEPQLCRWWQSIEKQSPQVRKILKDKADEHFKTLVSALQQVGVSISLPG